MYGYGNSMFLATHGILARTNAAVLPVNTVAPAITGTAQEGQTLTCSTGTWTGTPIITYTYQWKRNGSNIGSATNSTYILVTADVGQSIKCTVTATNGAGSVNADSNTVGPISAFTGLLDTYSGAAVAYSLRKLRNGYTGNCIRVRRSSDNTEQDIGFVNNILDESSLLTFCGAGDGFVTRIYDQSGANNYCGQTTQNRQPLIVSAGATVTRNTKPSMLLFAGSTERFLEESLTTTIATVSHSAFIVRAPDSSASTFGSFGLSSTSSTNQYESVSSSATNIIGAFRNGGSEFVITGLAYTNNQLYIVSRHTTATNNRLLAVNNTNTYTSTTTLASFNATYILLNRVRRSDTITGRGYISEYVLYNSNQTSNRTGIETNMNAFYSTY